MFKRILVLSPHTDDGELGCGGSIAKFVREGKEVFYVAFSSCRKSVPENFDKDVLKREVKTATKVLGILKENLILLDFEVREFPLHRQEILEEMIKLRGRLQPDLVFVPSSNDVHQDHKTVNAEALRAFKKSSIIIGYEHPWNNMVFSTDLFIVLEKQDIDKKVNALLEYKSQHGHNYFNQSFIRAWAHTRGIQTNADYAETFEIIRWIIR